MWASLLSALGSLSKLPDLFLSFQRWMQRNKLRLTISRIEFQPKTAAGAALIIDLINRTDRPVRVWADVTLQSGEVLHIYGSWGEVPPEDKRTEYVSLVANRKNQQARPQIGTIKLYDSVDRLLFVPKHTVERLNDQILNNWPFSEDEAEET